MHFLIAFHYSYHWTSIKSYVFINLLMLVFEMLKILKLKVVQLVSLVIMISDVIPQRKVSLIVKREDQIKVKKIK